MGDRWPEVCTLDDIERMKRETPARRTDPIDGISYVEERWRKVREQIAARYLALAQRGLNQFGDPLGTDYSYNALRRNGERP